MCDRRECQRRNKVMGANRHPRTIAKYEESLAYLRPDLTPEYMGAWDPATVFSRSKYYCEWECSKCKKRWCASVNNRGSDPVWCKNCNQKKAQQKRSVVNFKESVLFLRPDLLKEYRGEIDLGTLPPFSSYYCQWECLKCRNKWGSTVANRFIGQGCGDCGRDSAAQKRSTAPFSKSLAFLFPKLLPEYRGKRDPKKLFAFAAYRCDWKCSTCGHEWCDRIANRTTHGRGCKNCAKYGFKSNVSSFVYLVHRPGQMKIGIANHESGRMDKHQRHGWSVLCKIEMNGSQAMFLEKTVKSALKAKGVPTGSAAFMFKFDGYTETWPEEYLKVRTIRGLCRKLGINLEAFLAA